MSLEEQLAKFDVQKDQPWILVLPGDRVTRAAAEAEIDAVVNWCEENDVLMPLIVFGKLSDISALDKEQMAEHGWAYTGE